MYIYIAQTIPPIINSTIILHGLGIVCLTFFGAFLAYWFNRYLHNRIQKAEKKAKLLALITNITILLEDFINIKKLLISKNKESKNLEAELKERSSKISSNSIKLKTPFEALFMTLQVSKRSLDIDVKEFIFIAEFNLSIYKNLSVYKLILVLNKAIHDLNRVIYDFNNHVENITKKESNSYSELEKLCSFAENVLKMLDTCIFFVDLALPLLIHLGKKSFKSFKIAGTEELPEEYQNFLPPKDYIKGWDDLQKIRKSIE